MRSISCQSQRTQILSWGLGKFLAEGFIKSHLVVEAHFVGYIDDVAEKVDESEKLAEAEAKAAIS